MDMGLEGKVAFIGGASKGLGRACAIRFAREGANVVIVARSKEKLTETAEYITAETGMSVCAITGDLSKKNEVNRIVDCALERFKKIDVLVVNSGGPKPGTFFSITPQDWETAYQGVFYYVVELYTRIIPVMKKHRWGRIINIASLSVKEPADTLVLSNVFRSAVVSMAKTLSRELIASNITINTVCPGAFKTDRAIALMAEEAQRSSASIASVEAKLIDGLPAKRYQMPEELGGLVAFLASESAASITGATISIDGGISKGIW